MILCSCVCKSWLYYPVFPPGGPGPDRQNPEHLVIKGQRNAVRGSLAASVYHIITDRQREEGCRLQFKHLQPCRATLQLVGLNYTASQLMVEVGAAGRDEQHERNNKVLDFSLIPQVQTTFDMLSTSVHLTLFTVVSQLAAEQEKGQYKDFFVCFLTLPSEPWPLESKLEWVEPFHVQCTHALPKEQVLDYLLIKYIEAGCRSNVAKAMWWLTSQTYYLLTNGEYGCHKIILCNTFTSL